MFARQLQGSSTSSETYALPPGAPVHRPIECPIVSSDLDGSLYLPPARRATVSTLGESIQAIGFGSNQQQTAGPSFSPFGFAPEYSPNISEPPGSLRRRTISTTRDYFPQPDQQPPILAPKNVSRLARQPPVHLSPRLDHSKFSLPGSASLRAGLRQSSLAGVETRSSKLTAPLSARLPPKPQPYTNDRNATGQAPTRVVISNANPRATWVHPQTFTPSDSSAQSPARKACTTAECLAAQSSTIGLETRRSPLGIDQPTKIITKHEREFEPVPNRIAITVMADADEVKQLADMGLLNSMNQETCI